MTPYSSKDCQQRGYDDRMAGKPSDENAYRFASNKNGGKMKQAWWSAGWAMSDNEARKSLAS